MLLIGRVLLTKSLIRLQDVSPGFDPRGLLVADAPLSPVTYATAAKRNQLVDQLRARLETYSGRDDRRGRDGASASAAAARRSISTSWAGRRRVRKTTSPPVTAQSVRTISRRSASRFWLVDRLPSATATVRRACRCRERDVREAIPRGRRGARHFAAARSSELTPDDPDDTPIMEIVGVVGDTKQAFEAATQPTMFVPYLQNPIDVISGLYRALAIIVED